MNIYKKNGKILISESEFYDFEKADQKAAEECSDIIYILKKAPLDKSRKQYAVSDTDLIYDIEESPALLKKPFESFSCPDWLKRKIVMKRVSAVNTGFEGWEELLQTQKKDKWKINIAGLGDVGGMLLTGLRLVGGDAVSKIGIYDLDENKMNRWLYEASQIFSFGGEKYYPEISIVSQNELFNCDMFVFTVSAGVPPVGAEASDVRMLQYEANSKIVSIYAKMARQAGFKGIFAVVSDPVDLLCKSAYKASNTGENGIMDYKGVSADKIRGYGLGVMYARAAYYSKIIKDASHFTNEGRAYGPHGDGLVIANSIDSYNDELSLKLTQKTVEANLEVRKTGYKPYVAPALSSGCLSILKTIKGEYHYSSVFIGGVFMGCLNRMLETGTELERVEMPEKLYQRILNTYERLASF